MSQKKKLTKAELEEFLKEHKSKFETTSQETIALQKETKDILQKARSRAVGCLEKSGYTESSSSEEK